MSKMRRKVKVCYKVVQTKLYKHFSGHGVHLGTCDQLDLWEKIEMSRSQPIYVSISVSDPESKVSGKLGTSRSRFRAQTQTSRSRSWSRYRESGKVAKSWSRCRSRTSASHLHNWEMHSLY